MSCRLPNMMPIWICSPFERTAAENEQIYGALKHFEVLAGQVPANVLKELCVVAQLDVWKEQDLTSQLSVLSCLENGVM